ncbi:MAG: DNA-binding response regulator [Arcobacter sp.]|nr:DNA-binding response regulator [Arcobacter sp.]
MNESLLKQIKEFSILCVEDEDGIRKRLINTLEYYFDDIYEANCGNDGYDMYLLHNPTIVISDIQMNNGDGISLVKKIRENDINTKIVMLTAFSNEEYLLDLINLNINHYILKPLNSERLQEAILKCLDDKLNMLLNLGSDIYLDTANREISYKNEIIKIRKREKEFLQLLYDNKNSCVTSYTQIEEHIWEDRFMSTSALKTFIKEIRRKLPEDIIVNVPQEGYKLI